MYSNVKLCNVRKTAVFHDVIPGRRYSQSLVRTVGATSDSVEWSATLAMLQAESCVYGAAALCTEWSATLAMLQAELCVRCCCTLYRNCEAVAGSVQCTTGLTQSSMLLHTAVLLWQLPQEQYAKRNFIPCGICGERSAAA